MEELAKGLQGGREGRNHAHVIHAPPSLTHVFFFFRSRSVNDNWEFTQSFVQDLVNRFKKYGFSALCCRAFSSLTEYIGI